LMIPLSASRIDEAPESTVLLQPNWSRSATTYAPYACPTSALISACIAAPPATTHQPKNTLRWATGGAATRGPALSVTGPNLHLCPRARSGAHLTGEFKPDTQLQRSVLSHAGTVPRGYRGFWLVTRSTQSRSAASVESKARSSHGISSGRNHRTSRL